MKKILLVLCLALMATSLFAMPMSPELKQQLIEQGRYDAVTQILIQAKSRGVDSPNPHAFRHIPGRTDTLKAIAIMVDFSDNVGVTPIAHYDSILSSLGTYSTGSFRDYYLENSYGEVDIIMTVVGWLRMPQTYAYYVNGQNGFGNYPQNCQKLTEDAVLAANPSVDFSQFDNDGDNYIDALFIIHAGPGAEDTGDPNDIWSHAWVTSNVPYVDGVWAYHYSTEPENGKIGVFCHEAGHSLFGLEDLYDYDYDSYGAGMWTVMAFGSWGNGGLRPVHFDGRCKIQCGFLSPQVPNSNQTGVEFPRVEYNPIVYKLWTNGAPANEFFVVENRQKVGFDNYLPASGMFIYHVDENQSGNDNQWYPGHTSSGHYLLAVEQADGQWHLEKYVNSGTGADPYPGSLNKRFFNDSTTPDSKNYLFNATYVAVENISDSGDTMTADIKVTNTGIEEVVNFAAQIPRFKISPTIAQTQFKILFAANSGYGSSRLVIYNTAGSLVKSFNDLNSNQIIWYGDDDQGNRVSPGVYFVKLIRDSPGEASNVIRPEKIILIE